jgi:thioredoxin reductase
VTPAEAALTERARAELRLLAYPDRDWVKPRVVDGQRCADVLIVGGGMSGLAIAHGLARNAVYNVAVLDEREAGQEGVWESFARMPELRTPKIVNGMDFGQPSLSVQEWFVARHGAAAWEAIKRIPRQDWMNYLRWYRATLGIGVENGVSVTGIRPGPPGTVAVETSAGARLARLVVLATGFEGGGVWRVPDVVAAGLPADRYSHACTPIDFARFRGQRLGVLGHGASAFDAAVVALQQGAASVDLCFRRDALPTVNPHRHLESAGLMANWPYLPDPVRWNIARHMRLFDQPPAHGSFHAACGMAGFAMHAGSPWEDVRLDGEAAAVRTPRQSFRFDHVICATGYALDLAARPEWRTLAPLVTLWRDRYAPPAEDAYPELGAYPYLSPGYELQPHDPADGWVGRVHAFNFAAAVSMGPHSTSISGQKHALPRVVRALVQRLFLEQQDSVLPDLRAYDEQDITVPETFRLQEEAAHA